VVEQQSAEIGGLTERQPGFPTGELSVSALQSIGHGCDLLSWVRWRGQPAAQELNMGALLPHWGDPGRHYQELQELVAALRPHAERIAASQPLVTVARICDFEQEQLHRVEPWVAKHIGLPSIGGRALRALGLNEDRIRAADLRPGDGYRVALMPHAVALSDAATANLQRWVEAGGVLVVGPLAGHRDARLQADLERMPPGALLSLTGTVNMESTTWDGPMAVTTITGTRIDCGSYGEVVMPQRSDVQILARHMTAWLAGRAAVTERRIGKGRVIHCGTALSDAICNWLWVDVALPKPRLVAVTHEAAAEVLVRSSADGAIYFVLNHGNGPVVCYLHRPLRDLVDGKAVRQSFTLNGHSWRVLVDDMDNEE